MAPPKAETTPSDTDDDYQSNVSSFLQRMYNPSITRDIESRMDPNDADLIHVPWKLSHTDDNGEKSNGAHIQSDVVGANNNDSSPVYPSMSYLDLRRIQNTEWATDRLREGVRLAKEGKAAKAEECYKEGIDLVPTHAQLFVAYGALCANLGRTREAIDKLEYALELDPNVANAQAYINVIRNKVPPRQAGSVSRSQTAMKDALMERSFLQEKKSSADNQNEKYPLLHEEEEEKMDANNNHDETKDAKRKHRHKKAKRKSKHRDRSRHRKSRSRRKRRKHHDFSSDNDSESDDSASDDGRRRRRRTDDTPHRKSPIVCTGLVQTKGVKNPIEDNDVIENDTNDDEIFRLMHHLMDQMTESTTAGSNARKIDDRAASPEKGHQASEHRQGKDSNK